MPACRHWPVTLEELNFENYLFPEGKQASIGLSEANKGIIYYKINKFQEPQAGIPILPPHNLPCSLPPPPTTKVVTFQ